MCGGTKSIIYGFFFVRILFSFTNQIGLVIKIVKSSKELKN